MSTKPSLTQFPPIQKFIRWYDSEMAMATSRGIANMPNPFEEQRPPNYPLDEWVRHQKQYRIAQANLQVAK